MQFTLIKTGILLATCSSILFSCNQQEMVQEKLPNILFCIADDQSFPHAGAYGCDWVKTPSFDRVAREGILFTNAYTPNPKCAPSRACIITGRNPWQLEAAANHVCYFPEKFKTYTEALHEHGYFTGYTGKGWAPGNPGIINGKKRDLLGQEFNKLKTNPPTRRISNTDYAANFKAFLEANKVEEPFCFWYGCREPHRPYAYKSGIEQGNKKLTDIQHVYNFLPHNDTVRTDMLDYAFEIEYFDQHLAKMLQILEEKSQLDNTLVVVTSDNGMPFPRIKGQEYEYSNHLPLAMMWGKGIKNPGRIFNDIVSFTDFAPTFLEIAGVLPTNSGMKPMEGQSLTNILKDDKDATGRNFIVIGKERHDMGRPNDEGYPIRGIIEDGFLYEKNYHPERWPAGNPETGYLNCDGSPTKSNILNDRRQKGSSAFWSMSFGKRPAEELYEISKDPECMVNLADDPAYAKIKAHLSDQMVRELKKEGDPRMFELGEIFDQYPYAEKACRNFYNRFMAGEAVKAEWINQSDIEKNLKY